MKNEIKERFVKKKQNIKSGPGLHFQFVCVCVCVYTSQSTHGSSHFAFLLSIALSLQPVCKERKRSLIAS